ncbi:unnamed protein product [Cuscuta epithymum]|uniref:Uncharacterized protein n=1 Tax=Cuscuta epithymum TaxID=186058 RepID=A0AAV0DQK7_9ASTE|nr:unnamed protein product [Cuscuta epithymum]
MDDVPELDLGVD